MNIKELVRENTVKLVRYQRGNFIYTISYNGRVMEFPVPLFEVKDLTLEAEDKADNFIKYIKRHLATLY